MNTGEKIKAIRKEMGISAEYIASNIGVSPSTIYRYENNDIASMKIDKLKAIASILHTSASYLLGWKDDPASVCLTVYESILLSVVHDMNESGQEKVLEYAKDLRASNLYKKSCAPTMVETA